MKTRPKLLNQRGTTLLEVVIALVVFSIGLRAIVAASTSSHRSMRTSRAYGVAAIAAQSTMDSLKSLGWAALSARSGSYTVKGHAVRWSVSGTNLRRIVVIVTRQVVPMVRADSFVTYVAQ